MVRRGDSGHDSGQLRLVIRHDRIAPRRLTRSCSWVLHLRTPRHDVTAFRSWAGEPYGTTRTTLRANMAVSQHDWILHLRTPPHAVTAFRSRGAREPYETTRTTLRARMAASQHDRHNAMRKEHRTRAQEMLGGCRCKQSTHMKTK